jgi:hypothetical protein
MLHASSFLPHTHGSALDSLPLISEQADGSFVVQSAVTGESPSLPASTASIDVLWGECKTRIVPDAAVLALDIRDKPIILPQFALGKIVEGNSEWELCAQGRPETATSGKALYAM